MQFQADTLGKPLERAANLETTAMGAAFLAGLAAGLWKNRDELKELCHEDTIFSPDMSDEDREDKYSGWKRAVQRSMRWAE